MQSPVWPFQTLQSRILSLRSRLLAILVGAPSLVLHCSRIHEDPIYREQWDAKSDSLIRKASQMSDDVKKWVTAEAEPLFFSNISSQRVIHGHIEYPDLISGVLDCVANTALLTLSDILRFLCHVRLRSSSLPGQNGQHRLETSQLLDNQETIEQWRQRAMTAFKFVQGQSEFAAKPLAFGLQQVHSSGLSGSIDVLDEQEEKRRFSAQRKSLNIWRNCTNV